jgi:hypothetical protein
MVHGTFLLSLHQHLQVYSMPGFTANAEASAYLGIILKLYVEAVIVPSAKPSGYLKLSADIQNNPRWRLGGGINAPFSIDLSAIGVWERGI